MVAVLPPIFLRLNMPPPLNGKAAGGATNSISASVGCWCMETLGPGAEPWPSWPSPDVHSSFSPIGWGVQAFWTKMPALLSPIPALAQGWSTHDCKVVPGPISSTPFDPQGARRACTLT